MKYQLYDFIQDIKGLPLAKDVDEINISDELKDIFSIFSSLIRERVIAKLEEKFPANIFSNINENTSIIHVLEIIRSHAQDDNINTEKYKIRRESKRGFYKKNKSTASIGIDIEHEENMPDNIFDLSQHLIRRRLFLSYEINYALKKENPIQTLLGIFCAKEAFIKAVGEKIDFSDILISHDYDGQPQVKWKNLPQRVCISIAHSYGLAVAICIMQEP